MADAQGQENKAALLFPNPPPFWQDFTPDRLESYTAVKRRYLQEHPEAIAEAKRAAGQRTGVEDANTETSVNEDDIPIRIPNLARDLTHLQPPPEPSEGRWRLYGEQQTLHGELQSLEGAGIERLGLPSIVNTDGKHADLALELKRLSKSLLLNFLEWMGTMSQDPQKGSEKIQDIKTLLLNFHHILNEYRPHQAREQLIAMMQDQLDAKRKETQGIRGVVDKAKRMLEGLGSIDAPEAEGPVAPQITGIPPPSTEKYWDRETTAWGTVDEDFA